MLRLAQLPLSVLASRSRRLNRFLFICLHTKILTTAVDTIRVNTPKIAATIGKTLLFSLGFLGGEAVAGSVTVFARPEEDPGYVDDVVDADGVVVVDDVEVTVVDVLFSEQSVRF